LAKTRKITRGPKPARALREIGLASDWKIEPPTSEGIVKALEGERLEGRRVGVQLYGQEPNVELCGFLERAGAIVRPVAPYVYAPASDDARVVTLIDRLPTGGIDAIAFTSAVQVRRLWEVAVAHQREAGLARG